MNQHPELEGASGWWRSLWRVPAALGSLAWLAAFTHWVVAAGPGPEIPLVLPALPLMPTSAEGRSAAIVLCLLGLFQIAELWARVWRYTESVVVGTGSHVVSTVLRVSLGVVVILTTVLFGYFITLGGAGTSSA